MNGVEALCSDLRMWIKEEGFKDWLKLWWVDITFNGMNSFILAEN